MRTLLIANRGEIACRVIRSARALGIATAAVYSEADAGAAHVRLADTAHCIGPGPARASYLNIEAILNAARRLGADALHPGYGFLAENAGFAEACAEAGLIFVGPPAAAMRLLGDKSLARRCMREAGLACVPGYDAPSPSDEALAAAARSLGFPLLVKAAGGGGGRGMRRVESEAALAEALRSARSEARAAFGVDALLLERVIERARHVEVQFVADAFGAVVHLGERDCSVQRRHQKLIEESPAPGLPAALRARMREAAVAAARAAHYVGAGTVEFLVAGGEFWFLEVNARLQVEHPVSEALTGIDLVEWQIRVACGEPLPAAQEAIGLDGHAIEARLCAEDPARDFAPAAGPVLRWRAPEGVRVDHGLNGEDGVPEHYDSLLAKLIAHGPTREAALERLARALRETVLLGVPTNRAFLLRCLEHPDFAAGGVTTDFAARVGRAPVPPEPATLALAAVLLHESAQPWRGNAELRNWSNTVQPSRGMAIECEAGRFAADLETLGCEAYRVSAGGAAHVVHVHARGAVELDFEIDRVRQRAAWVRDGDGVRVALPQADWRFADVAGRRSGRGAGAASDGTMRAAFSARVIEVQVAAGMTVAAGAPMFVLEAMKMEHPVLAPVAGRVVEVLVGRDAQVEPGALLARIEPQGEPQEVRRGG